MPLTLLRGSPETKKLITAARDCQTTHYEVLRQEGTDLLGAMNLYRGEIVVLQTQLQRAEMAEADTAISGKFYEFADKLKTADRLAAEVANSIVILSRHLAHLAELQKDLEDIASSAPPA